MKRMILIAALLALSTIAAAPSAAAAAPAWDLTVEASNRVAPGEDGQVEIKFGNSGDAATDGTGALDVTLPPGVTGVSVRNQLASPPFTMNCGDPAGQSSLHCDPVTLFGPLGPGQAAFEGLRFSFELSPSVTGMLPIGVQLSGGGAPTVSKTLELNASATPDFGILPNSFDGGVFASDGSAFAQAGGHPHSAETSFSFKTTTSAAGTLMPDGGGAKDIVVELPPGLIGNPNAVVKCPGFDYLTENEFGGTNGQTKCPADSQVGVVDARVPFLFHSGVFNMEPLPGAAATFGFNPGVPVLLNAELRSDGDYGINLVAKDTSQAAAILGVDFEFWGVPADPSHDAQREGPGCRNGGCPSGEGTVKAFLTNPTSCTPSGEGVEVKMTATPWSPEASPDSTSFESHQPPGLPLPPEQWGPPQGPEDCDLVPYKPRIAVEQTTDSAETPTGLDFELNLPSDGLLNPDGIAESSAKKATVTLPAGVTLNPSAAEGLSACSPADLKRESLSGAPGSGCPNGSRLGSVEVDTPLLEDRLEGDVYLAQQDDPGTATPGVENPFDSLIALYIVIKSPERGIIAKLPGTVEPDGRSGRLQATFDDLPQAPFSRFHFKFREGGRAPLVSPPACGTYTVNAAFVPWSASDPENPKPSEIAHTSSQFQVTRGVGGGPCPTGGVPPFKPGFSAGSINNNAASHTEFNMRLTRQDGEQNMTRFSATLPPGVLGKLAGVDKCPSSAIALAKSKTGRREIANPSCPANSLIGKSLVGGGVGSVLTYVPGKIYLGGPFNGRPLSVIAITPAVAGPFDIGTVVVQEALTLNPKTAEVEIDGSASDPIPHILEGIPVKLRDLRVYVDRPNFVINPTSCDRSDVQSTLSGSFLDVFNPADDVPVSLSDRFQASNCSALGFKPKLGLTLKGGTKRGGHPGLKALYRPRPKDANLKGLVVRLPRSAFLDQAHIRTICTRVQFAADACPRAAQYGNIKAWTPLLEEPLQGPVWLRSSSHKLPDLVFDLHGLVDVEVATRIDSAKGGIRATVEDAPDAPLSKVELRMQGGKKGLIVNSRNLCSALSRANVEYSGHNGKEAKAIPVMRADCGGKRKR